MHAGPAQTVISVRVELEQTIITPGTSTTVPDLFATPPITDPARAAQIVYPLDRAVMMAENMAKTLAAAGWQVSIRHRELERRMSGASRNVQGGEA